MSKAKTTVYWIVTIFLSVGMLAGGIQQLLQIGGYVPIVNKLGYPTYVLSILGLWKILGVAVILLPGYRLLKEWAYAGFFFAMSGAAASHIIMGEEATAVLPAIVLLAAIIASWYLRPANRKLAVLATATRSSSFVK